MKNVFTTSLLVLVASFLFTSCFKDKCTRTYTYYTPVYKPTAEVRANIKSNSPRSIERAGKLFIRGNYIFLNEIDRGFHIIDNTNPSAPKNVAFVDIPGNIDIAVKGNTLYADAYADMVTIDIANPLQVQVKKFNDKVFPYRMYTNGFISDSSKTIVDWVRHDTTVVVDCDANANRGWIGNCPNCLFAFDSMLASGQKSSSPFGAGVGGSMARFTIVNDYLYTVTKWELNVFNISTPTSPMFSNKISAGWNIETIYPFKDKLFIGGQSGMYIFGLQNPAVPNSLGRFNHATACDPVVADDKYAYVTLRSGRSCDSYSNQLDVIDISNLTSPTLVKTYPLTNPYGLSKDGNLLFVCDGKSGVRIYDASNVNDLKLLKQIKNINTYDVIAFNKRAFVVADDGLYQFDYTDLNDVKLLSKVGYTN